jgi:hypothetical protein
MEADIPIGRMIHVVLDNYATHKHPKVRASLAQHPRFVCHFTPTSASWLHAVEGFFAKLTRRRLKRGVFRAIVDLQAAINRFLRETNEHPKPFVCGPPIPTRSSRTRVPSVRFDPLALITCSSHLSAAAQPSLLASGGPSTDKANSRVT